jgi:hypothetical protein
MIPHKNLPQESNNDDMDIGEEDSQDRNMVEEYVTDSHFIQNKSQESDKYKEDLIEKLLQEGKSAEKKKKPNIQKITDRLYKNNKPEPPSAPDNNEKITDFKKASAIVIQITR